MAARRTLRKLQLQVARVSKLVTDPAKSTVAFPFELAGQFQGGPPVGNLPLGAPTPCSLLPSGSDLQKLCLQLQGQIIGAITGGPDPAGCPPATIQVGDTCVDLTAAIPGGEPLTFGAGGSAVQGAFGMPATQPGSVSRTVRRCGKRMVLGIDNLCYPKAVLPARSKFRKWRRPPRATVSRSDEVAIRKAKAAKERVLTLAKDVGLHASKTKPSSSRRKAPHSHRIAAPTLQVISEETN